ncbi:MAG: ABC transporter permease [Candidatus Saccharibacteria bacterium]
MSPVRTIATAKRVLNQLRRDHRTMALIIVMPCVLIALLKYVFDGEPQVFNMLAPMILGIFPLLIMFLVTSIATLRERTSGTLDRLMTQPISKLDFIFGYAIGFGVLATIQALVTSFVTLGLLGVTVEGGSLQIVIVAVTAAFLGTSLGLFVSAFAKTEFQAVQLVMPSLMPQILLCGLFVPREHMAKLLRWLSDIFPLTYSVDAMRQVSANADWSMALTKDLIIVGSFAFVALILASLTIQRQER